MGQVGFGRPAPYPINYEESMNKKNQGQSKLRRIMLYLLIIAGIAGMGYSGYQIFGIQAEYDKGDQLYDQLRQDMYRRPEATETEGEGALALPGAGQISLLDMLIPSASAEAEAQAEGMDEVDLRFDEEGRYLGNDGEAPPEVEKPRVERKPSVMDFARLAELNPDTVGWLSFNDGVIDYPIVQGNNNKFYLTHLFNREYGKAGTIFIDVTNAPDFSDQNTLIFGHHMNNGSMFANVEKYQTQEYYEQYPVMELYTPQGDGLVEWFAGYAISAHRLPTIFESEEAFLAHVAKAKEKSHFKTDVEVGPGDRIVTLVTCTYGWEDARYILMGVIRDEV